MTYEIKPYSDGGTPPIGFNEMLAAWNARWASAYRSAGEVAFLPAINIKDGANLESAPPSLRKIAAVRNPDIYFAVASSAVELGGVEMTTHSPDGSNIEERYPYLWASRRAGISAFIATPYLKKSRRVSTSALTYASVRSSKPWPK